MAGGVQMAGDLRELVLQGVQDRPNWAWTEAVSGWSKTECSSARTQGYADFGVAAIRFARVMEP